MKEYKKNTKIIKTLNKHYEKISDYYMEKCVSKPGATFQEIGLLILSKEINELSKSVLYLAKNDAMMGLSSLNRDILERYIYIKQIMSNSDSAKAYYLKNQLTGLELLLKINGIKTYQNKKTNIKEYQNSISNMMGKTIEEVQKSSDGKLGKIDEETQKNLIEEYRDCFTYSVPDDHIFRQKWYNFNKKTRSLEQLARENNLIDDYLTLYSAFSSEVHSSNFNGIHAIVEVEERAFLRISQEPDNKIGLTFASKYLRDSLRILLDHKNMPKKFRRNLDEDLHQIVTTANFTLR